MNVSVSGLIGKMVTLIVFTACIAGGYWYTNPGWPFHAAMPVTAAEDAPEPDLEQVRPGWWESGKRIYFDIPARVLFRLPENPDKADAVSKLAWAEFERIGRIFNPYAPDSEVFRLNAANTTGPVPVSADMWHVLQLSETLFLASDGAFDPTMLPVKRLWQDAEKTQQVPSARTILGTLSKVGFDKVRLIERQRAVEFDKKGIQFDFGGAAKGYAVDRVVALLQENGIAAGLVQLGGEVAAFGENDGGPWRIGIQDPMDMTAVWGIVSARSGIRVSTSGNYRQPIVITGHRFYHIFSPKTGRPVSEKILGVTTTDFSSKISNAMLDGAATAIAVMGSEAGMEMAEALGIEALVIKETGQTPSEITTNGFQENYERLPGNTEE